jgi:hypothetical protein
LAALGTFAAAADFCPILDGARVHNAGIIVSAEWANHLGVSPFEMLKILIFGCIGELAKLP